MRFLWHQGGHGRQSTLYASYYQMTEDVCTFLPTVGQTIPNKININKINHQTVSPPLLCYYLVAHSYFEVS